jgi:hypothetical protein
VDQSPPTPPRNSPHALAASRADLLVGRVIAVAWIVNVGLLIAACAWIFFDPGFMRPHMVHAPLQQHLSLVVPQTALMTQGRMEIFRWLTGAALATLAAIALGLLIGAPWNRRLRSWLAFTAIAAAWLALKTSWPELAWAGAQWRVGSTVAAFEAVAEPLRANWPAADGATDALGPFSAYPAGKPRMLMLLQQIPADRPARFTAIERSDRGGLRFELAGPEAGAWLEWHPPGEQPSVFVGGLETRYDLERSSPLGDGWFLTQYGERFSGPTFNAN